MTTDVKPTTMDTLEGMLTGIRYHAPDTGFLIGIFQCGKDEYAGLGTMINPEVGMAYKMYGKWAVDKTYGKQFRFSRYEVKVPKSTDGIFRYLVRIAKWVGPKVGTALIDRYGIDTMDVLKTDPERVAADINGITLERAREIQQILKNNEALESALIQLEELLGGQGLRSSLPGDLIARWGHEAVERLKENPYILTKIRGIGFPSADQIALGRFKVDPKSIDRQKAAVQHALNENAIMGHVWAEEKNLMVKLLGLLGYQAKCGLDDLVGNTVVRDGEYVTLWSMAKDERYVADKIVELLGRPIVRKRCYQNEAAGVDSGSEEECDSEFDWI